MHTSDPNLKLIPKDFLRLYKFEFLKPSSLFTKGNKNLISNFLSLGIIQGANILLPLLTFPYIVKVIGVENFGLIAILQTIMNYFVVFTDYGFNMSATKDISVNRTNKIKTSHIFSEVLTTKVFLCALSFLLLIGGVLLSSKFQEHASLIYFSFFIVIGQLLQPTWFFQGIERMKYITYITLITKALYAAAIFIFITEPTDYIYVNLITGCSGIVGGLVSLVIAIKTFKISFFLPKFSQLRNQLLSGWNIFVSSVTITIANNTNILVLSLFANVLVVGYYSIAEKVFYILRTFTVVLYQVIYPRVCLLSEESYQRLAHFLRKILILVVLLFLPLSVTIFFLADYIILFISGKYLGDAALVLKIVCFGPFIAALNIPAAQTMLAYQFNKKFAIVASIGAAVNIISNMVLAYYFQAVGTAFSIIITESVITVLLYYVLGRHYPQCSLFKSIKI